MIIGNSGSGKTWLAKRLASKRAAPVVHLDDIFWLEGGFDAKRDPAEAAAMIRARRAGTQWIAEGVYGKLAEQFLLSALSLVWLDIPGDTCQRRLRARGSESKAHMARAQSEQGLRELIEWAGSYGTRQDSSGRAAHRALFESFNGQRVKLGSESEVLAYLEAA
ncbi:hypothetical protein ASC95_09400 [Pelomonas sp. Root1217]|nr:hypothetical protein ASC95_09400 [Pelomonas sp. Root1217]